MVSELLLIQLSHPGDRIGVGGALFIQPRIQRRPITGHSIQVPLGLLLGGSLTIQFAGVVSGLQLRVDSELGDLRSQRLQIVWGNPWSRHLPSEQTSLLLLFKQGLGDRLALQGGRLLL